MHIYLCEQLVCAKINRNFLQELQQKEEEERSRRKKKEEEERQQVSYMHILCHFVHVLGGQYNS